MNAVIEFLFPTPEAGLAWALALSAVGVMVMGRVLLNRDDRRDAASQQLEAEQDEAISLTIAVEPLEPTIPLQRSGGAS